MVQVKTDHTPSQLIFNLLVLEVKSGYQVLHLFFLLAVTLLPGGDVNLPPPLLLLPPPLPAPHPGLHQLSQLLSHQVAVAEVEPARRPAPSINICLKIEKLV